MTGGYDKALVPEKLCLMCKLPIGSRAWSEVPTLARFGQMLFQHKVCPEDTVFICPGNKCAYAIASTSLNELQLKMLRRTAKKCPGCGTLQRFMEQTSLPNIQTKNQSLMEGQNNEDLTKNRKRTPQSDIQQGRAADGYTRL